MPEYLATDGEPSLDLHRCSKHAQCFFLENSGEALYGANYALQADHAAFGGIALSLVFGPRVG